MLVIISDLHLTDGSTTESVAEESFQVLGHRLQELAWRGSWRTGGKYRPLEHIDLLLLGDVLDLVRTARWLDADVRPWSDPTTEEFAGTVKRVVADVLNENAAGLETLRSLASGRQIALPPATRDGAPSNSHEHLPVAVRLHYMVGDHDWFLHLPGEPYNAIRAEVASHLGLATDPNEPFPHDPRDSAALRQVLQRHRVLARHGDVFDPLSFSNHRDQSGLSDMIAVQLIGRFRREVAQQVGEDLPPTLAASLDELDHLRPLTIIPIWLDAALTRSDAHGVVKSRIRRIWDRLTEEFLELEPVRRLATGDSGELLDMLARAFRLASGTSSHASQRAVDWLSGLGGGLGGSGGDSYVGHALLEQDFRNRRAKHVVYGHTHRMETTALDASSADGFVLNQMYFNAGTWRPSYEPTAWASHVREFVPVEHIHLLAFFQGDERSGRTFETCSHWLAPSPRKLVEHRLDVPAVAAVGPSKTPIARPHFRTADVHRTASNGRVQTESH